MYTITDRDVLNHFHALTAAQNGWLAELQIIVSENLFKPLTSGIKAAVNNNLLAVAAAANGHLEVIKWLVKSGIPLDLTAQNNRTIKFAVKSGNLDLVRWLVLESGQRLDVTAENGFMEELAVDSGFIEIAQFLGVIAKLLQIGVPLNHMQQKPRLVEAVQSGKLRLDILSEADRELITEHMR